MSALIQLVYTSRATHRITASDLDRLTATASDLNRSLNITGLLLYGGGRYLQLLEGPPEVVDRLYRDDISKDPRHTDCMVLMKEPCEARLLPKWSMGRLYLQDVDWAAQSSWDALCAEIAKQSPASVFSRSSAVMYIRVFIDYFEDARSGSEAGRDPRLAGRDHTEEVERLLKELEAFDPAQDMPGGEASDKPRGEEAA